MVEYYQLFNVKVPKQVWSEIAEKNHLSTMRNIIQADIDSVGELRGFIECILDLLGRGYVLNKNFQFITANIDEIHD